MVVDALDSDAVGLIGEFLFFFSVGGSPMLKRFVLYFEILGVVFLVSRFFVMLQKCCSLLGSRSFSSSMIHMIEVSYVMWVLTWELDFAWMIMKP